MKATVDIEISRPINEVWEFVADVENQDKWVTGVSEPRITSDGEFGVGSTYFGKYTYRNQTFDVDYLQGYSVPRGRPHGRGGH